MKWYLLVGCPIMIGVGTVLFFVLPKHLPFPSIIKR
jgi:hypothetical protein